MAKVRIHVGEFSEVLAGMLRGMVPGVEFVASGDDCEILVTWPGAAPAAAITPSVRWIHLLSAGADGFPFEVLGDRTLTCSRGASAVAIAEWVLAVMLAFEKKLPESWIGAPVETWNRGDLGTLHGKTLGLIGLGSIGTQVARRALAFDMRMLAVKRTHAPPALGGVTIAGSLHDLLAASDHVVVCAPATPDTDRLLDADAFAAIKHGAHLVNIARGSIIDQDALLDALDAGRVAVASLDVVTPEPLPEGHHFYTHPRVRLSPHISYSSPDATTRTVTLFVENLARYRAGEPLHGIVDPSAAY